MDTKQGVWIGFTIDMRGEITLERHTLPLGGICSGSISLRIANDRVSKKRTFSFAEGIIPMTHPIEMELTIQEGGETIFAVKTSEIPSIKFERFSDGEAAILGIVVKETIALITHMETTLEKEMRDYLSKSSKDGYIVLPIKRNTKGVDRIARIQCTEELKKKIEELFHG